MPTHHTPSIPSTIRDLAHLEDLLSEPTPGVIDAVRQAEGDFIILGVGGKMGPTLARMVRRAVDAAGGGRRVIGVSRFTSADLPNQLRAQGVEPIQCDLLDPDALSTLPDARNVIYMAGMKFGATGQQARTWAMNAFLPGLVARKYRRARIAAFSTGNVYPMVGIHTSGCTEATEPAPTGEYAMSCLGRERILEHFSRALDIPMTIIRLNYAVEMRYGVLVDIALQIMNGQPIDLAMGHLNAIWQADANSAAIQSLAHATSPPTVLNVTGPETLSVRAACEALGRRLGKEPIFVGAEGNTALLSNAQRALDLFGSPRVGPERLIDWTADWISRRQATHGKPTHFETRDGRY